MPNDNPRRPRGSDHRRVIPAWFKLTNVTAHAQRTAPSVAITATPRPENAPGTTVIASADHTNTATPETDPARRARAGVATRTTRPTAAMAGPRTLATPFEAIRPAASVATPPATSAPPSDR